MLVMACHVLSYFALLLTNIAEVRIKHIFFVRGSSQVLFFGCQPGHDQLVVSGRSRFPKGMSPRLTSL